LRIDSERCQGHARCIALAPDLFELDPLGNAQVTGGGIIAPGREAKARLAQASCPETAIEISEEGHSP
jgi:ferredoxin